MKIPVSWLRTYVDLDASLEKVCDALTFAGIEVEAVEKLGLGCDGVIVGEVRQVRPHPNADRLTLCSVYDGEKEWPVVCGAPNVREGMHSAFARIGSALPGDFTLKKAKIRGEISEGMLCAEDELGLSGKHDGILELPESTQPGTPLSEIYGEPETVIEVEITPNRPDCLSLIGVAREVAALYGSTFRKPEIILKDECFSDSNEAPDITVEDTEACPRYVGRILSNVQVRPSPDWMQRHLRNAGLRPINNIVDITNFVMLETGHPLHAFDLDALAGRRLIVRRAADGEPIQTLDGQTHKLRSEHLVIADAEKPVALAGVMGGANSEISEQTTTVLLESAAFDPDRIRLSSRELGLVTDSSYRFERDVDPEGVATASSRALALMAEYAGARIHRQTCDLYPVARTGASIPCRWEKIRSLSGLDLPNAEIVRLLQAIECNVLDEDEAGARIEAPSFRPDLSREVDLVEEVTRLYGLDRIPVRAPCAQIVPGAEDRAYRRLEEVKSTLSTMGLHEIMNYSLVSHEMLDELDSSDRDQRIELPNPISADQSVIRPSLLPQMLLTLARNQARQIEHGRFFEVGNTCRQINGDLQETLRLSFGHFGESQDFGVHGLDSDPENAFHALKANGQSFLQRLGVSPLDISPAGLPWSKPGLGAVWSWQGKDVGCIGILSDALRKKNRFSGQVVLVEINLSLCLNEASPPPCRYQPYSRFPATSRDISLIAPKTVLHRDIEQVIRDTAPKDLENIRLFDIFTSESIGDDKKSMAYSITYRSSDRSFTVEEVNQLHEHVRKALVDRLGVELR